jgi:hypothetical protein
VFWVHTTIMHQARAAGDQGAGAKGALTFARRWRVAEAQAVAPRLGLCVQHPQVVHQSPIYAHAAKDVQLRRAAQQQAQQQRQQQQQQAQQRSAHCVMLPQNASTLRDTLVELGVRREHLPSACQLAQQDGTYCNQWAGL